VVDKLLQGGGRSGAAHEENRGVGFGGGGVKGKEKAPRPRGFGERGPKIYKEGRRAKKKSEGISVNGLRDTGRKPYAAVGR